MKKRRKEKERVIEMLATKVMGWEKHEVELDLTDGGTQKFFDSWRLNGREVAVQWNPLQSIADAWMVVEKLFIAVVPQSPKRRMICDSMPQKAICQVAMRNYCLTKR